MTGSGLMRSVAATVLVAAAVALHLTGCSKRIEESPAYQAACHGPPLGSSERRSQALEDGYLISRQFDCIEKDSFAEVARQQAEWKAANTPEAIARRKAEFAQQRERYLAEQARRAAAEERRAAEPPAAIVLREIDVNTATEAEIAGVITVGPDVAAAIVQERDRRRFTDWEDLVGRVMGLRAAQLAFYASVCGLTVNGRSLEGAPPNPIIAAGLRQKYQRPPPN